MRVRMGARVGRRGLLGGRQGCCGGRRGTVSGTKKQASAPKLGMAHPSMVTMPRSGAMRSNSSAWPPEGGAAAAE